MSTMRNKKISVYTYIHRGVVEEACMMIILGEFPLFSIKICRGYSLEAPCQSASNEYPHACFFLCRSKKIISQNYHPL